MPHVRAGMQQVVRGPGDRATGRLLLAGGVADDDEMNQHQRRMSADTYQCVEYEYDLIWITVAVLVVRSVNGLMDASIHQVVQNRWSWAPGAYTYYLIYSYYY